MFHEPVIPSLHSNFTSGVDLPLPDVAIQAIQSNFASTSALEIFCTTVTRLLARRMGIDMLFPAALIGRGCLH